REVRTDGTGNLNMMFLGYNPKTENFSFALHRGEVKEAGDKATFFTLPDPKDPKKRIPRFYVINQSETTNPSILALIAAKEGNDYYQSKGIALERKTNSAGNIDVEVKSTDSLEYRARLGVARQNFLDAYRNNGASVDKIKYIENELAIFEKRMSLLSAINHKNPTRVTEFQNKTVETYEHLSKFLNNKNPTFVGYFNKFKLELVENIIFQAANPTRINQGFNPTCNITSVEIFTAYVSPNRYAEFILNVAQNGQYSNGEKSHNFNARNLVPEYGYYKGWSPNVQAQGSNIRSPASRLFQVGGINFTRGNNYFSTGNPEFNDNEIQRAARLIAREGFEYANIRRMSADHHSRLMKGIPVAYRSDNHIQAVIPQILEKGNGNYYINFYMDDSNGGTTYTNPVATLEKPVLKVNSLISNDVRLGDLLTSDVNVVFYSATWCDPCNRSYDSISRAANLPAIKDTPIIGLYSADSAQSLLEQKKHPPFTIQQFQLQRYQKALSQLSDGTKVSSFPTFFIVDREGNVLARHPGGITGEQLNSLLDTIKKAKK
ncbi:MAG: redoxin family protein, partial [Proteobacteria bacterium]|nr:redoxin family protein [Pseudomonadota bacterium]